MPLKSHSGFPDFSHLNLTTVRRSYLRQMMWSFKHFHEESVDRCVTDQLKEEQVLQALQADGSQGRQPQEELGEPVRGGHRRKVLSSRQWCPSGHFRSGLLPSLLLWVSLFAVGLQWCVDLLSEQLHFTGFGKSFCIYNTLLIVSIDFWLGQEVRAWHRPWVGTWVKEDDGSQAAKLRLIHLHISHFIDELGQDPESRQIERNRLDYI